MQGEIRVPVRLWSNRSPQLEFIASSLMTLKCRKLGQFENHELLVAVADVIVVAIVAVYDSLRQSTTVCDSLSQSATTLSQLS